MNQQFSKVPSVRTHCAPAGEKSIQVESLCSKLKEKAFPEIWVTPSHFTCTV